jgi:lipopolysaccharide/colanic/teichoic acid biosynthesis glycosyltransferase
LSGALKRFADVVGSAVGLIVLAPLLAGIALVVRITMGSPVLFRQVRPGYRGKLFRMYKFRTMRDATGPDGRPAPDAERLTRLGRALRSTSLDELPELWNVLKGDMSLVGPRPLLPEYLPLYTPEQARRHDVRPGVTGWAQINGRNAISWEQKLALDVWYVDHQSLWLDLRILLLTLKKVLVREGINQGEGVTMEPFRGTGKPAPTSKPAPVAGDVDDADVEYAAFH